MQVYLLEAETTDLPEVYAIKQQVFRKLFETYHDQDSSPYMESFERLHEKFMMSYSFYYLIKINQVTCGYLRITLSPEGKTAKIGPIAILPFFENQGIGKQAMLLIEKVHPQVECWQLDTILQESRLMNFYQSLGYRSLEKTVNLQPNMDLIYFEKKTKSKI